MKTYIYKGKTFRARSKEEVLRRTKDFQTGENLKLVVKISRSPRYIPKKMRG